MATEQVENAGREAGVRISTDPSEIDIDWVVAALSERAYWARGRSRETIEASIHGSLVFSAYRADRQVGIARVVTDLATFGWICDVFVDESERRSGVGSALMEAITTHPRLRDMRRLVLATRDAHSFYRRYGFELVDNPERWMIKRSSRP